jgi:hypothetical protein
MSPSRLRRRARPPRPERRASLLRAAVIGRGLVWSAVAVSAIYSLRSIDAYARSANSAPTRLVWLNLPGWLSEPPWDDILPRLETAPDGAPLLYADTDIHDPHVCRFVYENVVRSPWIERVRRVWKQNDGRVFVDADFRKPFAAVEKHGVAYLVDAEGVRLPYEWRAEFESRTKWLRVFGVRGRLPEAGMPWPGSDVQAGLRLAEYVYRSAAAGKAPFISELRGVEVSEYDEKLGNLRIMTIYPRIYIRWGHLPGNEFGVEAPAEAKLAALRKLVEQWGSLASRHSFSVRFAPDIMFDVGAGG